MDFGLTDKCGIVVGASRGIGKAIALELSREGVDLVVVARNVEALSAAAAEIAGQTGRKVIPISADVTNRGSIDAMVEAAATQLGALNILINSGSAPGGSPGATGLIDTIIDEEFLDDFEVIAADGGGSPSVYY